MKLYSEACERNRSPILAELRRLDVKGTVLEFASGTGMHAAHFSAELPEVEWQPTDQSQDALDSIESWRLEARHDRFLAPLRFDLQEAEPPVDSADAIFCANLIHVAPGPITERVFFHAGLLLGVGAPVILYGPFRYANRPLEPSNERFDEFLRERYDGGGIRLFEEVCRDAATHQFEHDEDVAMPANNRLQIFRKV